MTQREREILIASVSWTDKSLTVNEEKAFQAGARWADKTMIEKACEWLEEKNKMCMYELEMILGKQFINDFKQAMEE